MIVCVRMSTCSCCARSSALRSGRTPNAITIAPDAAASSTSFSVTAPTPEPMIFSFTWSVESFGSISPSTSADVQGSAEVLGEMLPKLSTDQVKLKIIGSGVGAVTENDVLLAAASGAIVIAFGVRPDRKALDLAQQEHVDIRTHTIIYEVSDELKKAMEGLLEPVIQETYVGRAEVRNTFRVKGAGTVAGCYVVDG